MTALATLVLVASGLFGAVERGPTMPVCRIGMPCDEPAANTTLVFVHRTTTTRTRTDKHGRYRVKLAPGYYSVRTSARGLGSVVKPTRVRVRAGRFVRIDLHIDTGIR